MERLVETKANDVGKPPGLSGGSRPTVGESATDRAGSGTGQADGKAIADGSKTSAGGRTSADFKDSASGRASADGKASAGGRTSADGRTSAHGKDPADGRASADGKPSAEGTAPADTGTGADGGPVVDGESPPGGVEAASVDATKPIVDQAQDGDSSASDSKSADGGPTSPDNPYYVPELGFWERADELEKLWGSHLERWPDGPKKPGADRARPDDPPGSWRGDGDRYLSPDDNAEADKLIAELREPEEAVTALLMEIQQANTHDGYLVGLKYSLKGEDRLKEKFADKVGAKGDVSLAEAASTVNDAVRYTFRFDGSALVPGYHDVHRRLEAAGCLMTYRENHWLGNPEYKGVNSRWQTATGGRFELQFHAKESFHAKENLTHPAYERLRSPSTSRLERRELKAFQRQVAGSVPIPTDIEEITNYNVRN